MADPTANGAAAPEQATAQLALQKIYIKDASFEAPGAPQIFSEEGQPQLQLNLSQKVAGLAEVQQAGIFNIGGFEPRQLDALLGSYCPNALFPYVRQQISDMVQAGGFPPYFLQPINFDQLYAEQLRRRAEAAQSEAASPAAGNA